MATASIFQNYVQLVEHKALIIITKQIQEGNYKEQVEAIRKLIAEGQDKEADKLKKQLPRRNLIRSATMHYRYIIRTTVGCCKCG